MSLAARRGGGMWGCFAGVVPKLTNHQPQLRTQTLSGSDGILALRIEM